jgi:hypothetical protein
MLNRREFESKKRLLLKRESNSNIKKWSFLENKSAINLVQFTISYNLIKTVIQNASKTQSAR